MDVRPPLIADEQPILPPKESSQATVRSTTHLWPPAYCRERSNPSPEGPGLAQSPGSATSANGVPSHRLGLLELGLVSGVGVLAGPEREEWPPPRAATGSRHGG